MGWKRQGRAGRSTDCTSSNELLLSDVSHSYIYCLLSKLCATRNVISPHRQDNLCSVGVEFAVLQEVVDFIGSSTLPRKS